MKTKKPSKIIVCVAVSLAMMCTPVFGSYSYLANAHGVEDQAAASEQSDQGAQADQTNKEEQSGNEETPAAGSENVEEATEPGTDEAEGEAADEVTEPAAAPAEEVLQASDLLAAGDDDGDDEEEAAPVDFDLNGLATNAKIDATKDADGKYVIRAGTKYSIEVTFKETMERQFPNGKNDTMTYTLPEGLIAADGDTGTFSVRVNDGGRYYTVKNNTYEVSENKIIVRFNTSDENFDRMAAAANLTFTIGFEGEFDGENTEIKFEDEVVVDLDIDRSSSITVKKKPTDDLANDLKNGKISYTITVDSVGENTNVEIIDALRVVDSNGNAIIGNSGGFQYDPDIVSISFWGDNFKFSSNKRSEEELLGLPVNIGGTESTLVFYIPEMLDGETITIEYAVTVNLDNIPQEYRDGAIKVGNKVTGTSEEDTSEDTDDTNVEINYKPGINKKVEKDPQNPGVLHWTITVNDNAQVSVANRKITDKIGDSSKPFLTYSGDGITVTVTDASGQQVRTGTIDWEDLECTSENGKVVSWVYRIPETDTAPYKYVITYDTDVDTRGQHVDVTVSNKVDIDAEGNPSATGKIPVNPPDGYMNIKKRALMVDLEARTIEWGIDITVPKGGLETAYVRDTHPHTGSIYEPVMQDSIVVTGLGSNESFAVNEDKTNNTQTWIDFFYENNGGQKQNGLAGTGAERTVTVKFKTAISEDWLNKSSLTAHGNTINLNGKKPASDSIVVEEPGIKKNGKEDPVGYRKDSNGNELPVYRYELILSHVTKDENTITDTFDTSILKPYTPTPDDTWYKSNDAWYAFGGGTSSQTKKGSATYDYAGTSSGMTITTSSASLPHDPAYGTDSSKHYYARYKLVYYLTVKDKAAYDTIMSGAISDGKYPISNSADWEGNTDDMVIHYEYPGLTKEILTPDSALVQTDEDVWADFRITANPSAKTLNGGKPITLTDTADNLIIDVDSIKINGQSSGHGVTYTQNGHSMVYTIPDSTKIVITYSARVEYKDIGQQGQNVKVQFNNVAEMLGYDSDVKKTASRQNRGAGVASVPQINLMKYEAGDMTNKLEGAEFALLDKDGAAITDKNNAPVTFTTNEDGKITVRGDMEKLGWVLVENETYYLHETKAPKNHILSTEDIEFKISDDGTSDIDNHIYYSGETINFANYPIISLAVEKVWSDGNDLHDADEITVKLQQKIGDGAWSDTVRMLNDDNTWTDFDSITFILNKENGWKHTFEDLPTTVPTGEDFSGVDTKAEYRILETKINGKESEPVINNAKFKETTYDVTDGETDGVSTTKVKVTNVYVADIEVALAAEKKFEDGTIDEDQMFKFNVFEVTGTNSKGKKTLNLVSTGATTETGTAKSKVEFPPIRFTLDDLKKSDGTFASSRTFQYIIREARSPNADSKGFDKTTNIQYDKTDRPVTVTLSLDGSKLKAEVNYGKKGVPVFVNTKKPPEKPKNGSSTGDTAVLFPYILLLLLSLLTASIAVLNRRRRNS